MASSADGLQFVKDKLVGKWKLCRSENFEDFLREVGVNFVIRKMAATSKPEVEISLDGETIKMATKTAIWTREQSFKLGEEFEHEQDGVKQKVLTTVEGEKMIQKNTPVDPNSSVKAQTVTREIIDDEMVMTIHIGSVVCKRVFTKLPA